MKLFRKEAAENRHFSHNNCPFLMPPEIILCFQVLKGLVGSCISCHSRPAWRNRKLASIKRSDVSALHRAIGKNTPYEANRTLAQIAVMFTKAEEWGDAPEGYPNPARGIQTFKERKRSRWVRPDELPRLAEAIEKEPSIYVRSAIWLYLLTGLRKNELLHARWEHVNFEDKSLFLPITKADREHTVPLSDSAVAILANIPREADNPYIIPGRKAGSHLVNIRKPWRRILNRAVVDSWQGAPDVDEALINLREKKTADMRVRLGEEPSPAKIRRLPEPTADEIRKLVNRDLSADLLDITIHDLRRSVGSWLVSFVLQKAILEELMPETLKELELKRLRWSSEEIAHAPWNKWAEKCNL